MKKEHFGKLDDKKPKEQPIFGMIYLKNYFKFNENTKSDRFFWVNLGLECWRGGRTPTYFDFYVYYRLHTVQKMNKG